MKPKKNLIVENDEDDATFLMEAFKDMNCQGYFRHFNLATLNLLNL